MRKTDAMARSFTAATAALIRSSRLLRIVLWVLGLLIVYTVVGFLILPPLAKSILEDRLGEALNREVSIKHIAVNPFKLTAEVNGLSVQADGGREVLGLDTLYADVEAASLFQGGLVLREVRLVGPRLRVIRLGDDRYDISDLIDEWSKPSDSPTPHFSVSNIQVTGGKVTFVDKPKASTHIISDVTLRLPFLSSLPYQTDIFVEPHFSAKVNGSPLVLEGRSKPFAESHESELSLDLDKVDLARYLPYSPVRLPFSLHGGSLDTELKLLFRQDKDQPATLKLTGAFHVRNLALKETGGQPLLAWKELDVALREADLLQRRFLIDKVRIAGLDAHIRQRDGRLNWMDLVEELTGPGSAGKSAAQSKSPVWSVGEVRLEDATLHYQDLGQPALAPQVLDRVDARVTGLSSTKGQKVALNVDGRVNGSGKLKIGGDVRIEPFAGDLDIDLNGIPILPLQPYFGERLNLTLNSGQLSGKGRLNLETGADGLLGGFKGQLTLGDVQSVDKLNKADFLRWKSLFIGNIDAKLEPFALSVGEVALSDFYARLIVTPQGKLNLLNVVRRPEKAASEGTASSTDTDRETLPIRIGKVSLQGGTINFSDYFVKPNYTVNVTRIGGRITGLSSAPDSKADLELRGSYGNAAPVEVVAKLNPFAAKTYLDLKGEIRGVDLTTLSTYSGKYAGYAIDKGKLSLYVTYHLDHNLLTADNRVFLDQLTFGDRVESPSATSLPVKLAIALLKNRRGEIDVNLPVSGSIDDPQFSIGGVLARVIGNLFVRAVTSPFAFLGSLFGGGEELSSVDFDAGSASLGQGAVKRLQALAKAMNDRPALKLEIAGRADPEADREGMKRIALERVVKAEKIKALVRKGGNYASPEAAEVAPGEYAGYLQRAYKEGNFPKPRNLVGLHKDLPVDEMEKLLMANLPAGEEELRMLAGRRAEAVQAWLVEQGKVSMERLFVLAPKVSAGEGRDDKASPSRVDFSLR